MAAKMGFEGQIKKNGENGFFWCVKWVWHGFGILGGIEQH
jgi:hypothetical protein